MLGYVPIGSVISQSIPGISKWITNVPNVGSMRGISLGAGIGTIILGIRQLLGHERRHIESDEGENE